MYNDFGWGLPPGITQKMIDYAASYPNEELQFEEATIWVKERRDCEAAVTEQIFHAIETDNQAHRYDGRDDEILAYDWEEGGDNSFLINHRGNDYRITISKIT